MNMRPELIFLNKLIDEDRIPNDEGEVLKGYIYGYIRLAYDHGTIDGQEWALKPCV